jgi:CHAD domain-containing protein
VLEGARSSGHFAELEIELVEGGEDDLERLGRTLRRAGARTSDGKPKLLRVLPVPEQPATKHLTTLEQIKLLLRAQLQELEAHDPGVRLATDPEDLHKFRVATRRTRAIERATRPLLGQALEPLSAELKWLADLLGPVRDLDVLVERLRTEVAELEEDRAAGDQLVETLERERREHRDVLLEALGSDRYFDLLASFETTIALLPELDAADGLRPVARKQLRKLERAARKLPDVPSDEELHSVRIHAKRARYAAELAGAPTKLVDALKHVQDVIGEHQDAAVAEERLRAVVRDETALASGRLIERERARRAAQRAAYPAALRAALG